MAKYDLDLRMGLDEKLQAAELDIGALSYSIDTNNLYIDALQSDKITIERQQIDANYSYGLKYPDGQKYTMNTNEQLGENAIAFGKECIASGDFSFAAGFETEANGECSIAFGNNTIVDGKNSLSLGFSNIIKGDNSLVSGYNNIILNNNSFIIGDNNISKGNINLIYGKDSFSSGSYNHLTGKGLYSNNSNNFIIGNYNSFNKVELLESIPVNGEFLEYAEDISIASGTVFKEYGYSDFYIDENNNVQLLESSLIEASSPIQLEGLYAKINENGWIGKYQNCSFNSYQIKYYFPSFNVDNNLFIIGNGTGEDNRSNAFTVNTNGDTYISGKLNVNGIVNFSSNLQVNSLTVNESITSKNIEVSENITSNNLTVNENIISKNINVSNNITIKNDNVVTETVLEQTKTEIMTEVQQIADSIVTDVWYSGSEPPQETKLLWIRTGTEYANGILYYYTGDTTNTSNYKGWIPMSAAYS